MNRERFKRLHFFESKQWQPGCPVEIRKGAILHDTVKDIIILQLKLMNVGNKNINSVYVNIVCLDVAGDKITENNSLFTFVYEDLNVTFKEEFGEKIPIPLISDSVRRVKINISKVIYSDGEVWVNTEEANVITLPSQDSLDSLGNLLVEQFKREYDKSQWVAPYNSLIYIPTLNENLNSTVGGWAGI